MELMSDNILFIATDVGVYYTENQGDNWTRIGNNMPLIPVFDLEIEAVDNRLVAGTFARSIWSFPLDSLFTDPIGIAENLSSENITLYPNPVDDFVNLDTDLKIEGIELYTLEGKLERRFANNFYRLDLCNLSAGNYILKIYSDKGVMEHKLIKN